MLRGKNLATKPPQLAAAIEIQSANVSAIKTLTRGICSIKGRTKVTKVTTATPVKRPSTRKKPQQNTTRQDDSVAFLGGTFVKNIKIEPGLEGDLEDDFDRSASSSEEGSAEEETLVITPVIPAKVSRMPPSTPCPPAKSARMTRDILPIEEAAKIGRNEIKNAMNFHVGMGEKQLLDVEKDADSATKHELLGIININDNYSYLAAEDVEKMFLKGNMELVSDFWSVVLDIVELDFIYQNPFWRGRFQNAAATIIAWMVTYHLKEENSRENSNFLPKAYPYRSELWPAIRKPASCSKRRGPQIVESVVETHKVRAIGLRNLSMEADQKAKAIEEEADKIEKHMMGEFAFYDRVQKGKEVEMAVGKFIQDAKKCFNNALDRERDARIENRALDIKRPTAIEVMGSFPTWVGAMRKNGVFRRLQFAQNNGYSAQSSHMNQGTGYPFNFFQPRAMYSPHMMSQGFTMPSGGIMYMEQGRLMQSGIFGGVMQGGREEKEVQGMGNGRLMQAGMLSGDNGVQSMSTGNSRISGGGPTS
ncbi:hypothetical protein BGX38DRAFT_1226446, partial [Terfezia claveryi]